MQQKIHDCLLECKNRTVDTFTEATLKEDTPDNPFITKEQHAKKIHTEWENVANDFFKKIEQGIKILSEKVVELRKESPELFTDDVKQELNAILLYKENITDNTDTFITAFLSGSPIDMILGISAPTKECFYQAAKKIYDEKQFHDASFAFNTLVFLDPTNYTFWLSLGNCEYFLENYEPALYAYAFAAYADPSEPICHILSAQCYETIKEYDNAINACDIALEIIEDQEEWHYLKTPLQELKRTLTLKQ